MFPPELDGGFFYLMQFTDGNRIDLTLLPLDKAEAYAPKDKLTLVLLDKDGSMPELVPPTDEDYWVRPPSAKFFADCYNEFWWVTIYVAKGLWRKEILYAKEHLHNNVRAMLLKMLEWQVGIETNFSVSTGKFNKYLEQYLSEESWQGLLLTYAHGNYESTWEALFAACDLFCSTGKAVSKHFRYGYPYEDDERVTAYLKHIRGLSPSATEIY